MIIYNYIGRTVLTYILLAIVLVLGVDLIFSFVRQLRYLGQGDYTIPVILQYLILKFPGRIYNMFPMASLLGAIMGLGLLAGHSELVVMRASGISFKQITWAVLRVALALTVFLTLLGEFVLPYAEYKADAIRAAARGKGQALYTAQGIWIKDGSSFIHVNVVKPDGLMLGVTRYEYDDKYQLQTASYSASARFADHHWIVENTRQSHMSAEQIKTETIPMMKWPSEVSPNLLSVLETHADELSMRGLLSYIAYLKDNQLDYNEYSLHFWKKIFQPLATLIMVFLAVPFIFGPLRSATLGLRILSGVMLGFCFYILNELFGPLSLVYHMPPILGAVLPSLLFAGLAMLLLRVPVR